jgi:hypothetical protein
VVRPTATVALAWSNLRQEREGDREEMTTALLATNDDVLVPSVTDDASDMGLPLWLLDAASLARREEPAGSSSKEL